LQVNQEFLTQIAVLRRRIIKRELKRLVLNTLLLSTVLIALSLAVQKFGLLEWRGNSVYILLVLISFASSLLIMLKTKKSFLDELIEIDRRLELKDKLSTAYEYHQLNRESIFTNLLIKEAASLFGRIQPNPMVSRQYLRIYILIPLSIAVIITLLFADLIIPRSPQEATLRKTLAQISKKIERHVKQEAKTEKKDKKKSLDDIYRRMEKLAREMKTQKMSRDKLLQSLGDLMREVDAEQRRLTRKLKAELSLGDLTNLSGLQELKEEKITPDTLDELKKQIKQAFEQEIPLSLSQELASLDRGQRLEKFLDATMKEAMISFPDENEKASPEKKEKALLAQFSEVRENQGTRQNEGRPAPASGEGQPKKHISGAAGEGKSKDEASGAQKQKFDEDQDFMAGRGKADGQTKPPANLKGSKGQVLKDEGILGPGERYNIQVRSLPTIAKAGLKEEDIFRTYQKELEEVLKKEDIPLNYREYIKNYFLSIGFRKEENGKRDTN